MKRRLLLVLSAMLTSVGMWATDWVGNEPTNGTFYLYNVAADRYLSFGENWSSIATADHAGIPVTLTATATGGTYTITTNVASSGNGLFMASDMAYTDGTPGAWTFTDANVADKKVYTLKSGDAYLYWSGTEVSQVLSRTTDISGIDAAKLQWQLVTKDDRDAAFAGKNASESEPLDITYKYIQNPNTTWFTNVYTTDQPWTKGGDAAYGVMSGNGDWWDGKDKTYEVYNAKFDNYIEITDIPNGIYEFGVQGFYRDGGYADAIAHYHAGTFVENAKIYANGNTTSLQSIGVSRQTAEIYAGNDKSATVSGTTYYVPNSPLGGSLYFLRGKYPWQTVRTVVTNNTLRFGVKKETTIAADWTLVDKFYLSYLGVDLTALEEALNAAVATAESIDQSKLPEGMKNALATTISTYKGQTYTTEEDYNAALAAVNGAVNNANTGISSYAAFNTLKAQADELVAVENTNSEANSTLSTTISDQQTAVDEATTAAAIATATSTLKTAMITYAGAADPTSGNRFDLTFMLTNPDVTGLPTWQPADGWYTDMEGGNSQVMTNDGVKTDDGKNAFYEYWSESPAANGNFTLYQKVNLPAGTYAISCYAFSDQATGGDNRAVYFYANDTQGSLVSNNKLTEQGISFINDTEQEVKIGLKALTGNTYRWMGIGYVKLYKEYTDNATYNITTGTVANGSVDVTVDNEPATSAKALKTVTLTYTPVEGYAVSSVTATYNDGTNDVNLDVANPSANVYTFQMPAYDVTVTSTIAVDKSALAAAITTASAINTTANVGNGVFQKSATLASALRSALATAQTVNANADATPALVAEATTNLTDATTSFNNAALNAPAEGAVFNVMITTNDDYAFKENPLTFQADNVSGAYFPKNVGVKAYRAQQITFTKVAGQTNQYTMSMVNAAGDRVYIRTNATNKGGDGNTSQIRLTTEADYALAVEVVPTATDGVYNLRNTEANALLGCQDNPSEKETGGLYTVDSHSTFTITAAEKPSVTVSAKAGKYGTTILPFKPNVSTGFDKITFYSIGSIENGYVQIDEVATPAANVPYLIKNDDTEDFSKTLTGWGTATATSYPAGLLTGVYAENSTIPTGAYVLQTQNDTQAFYKVTTDDYPAAQYKAYLTASLGGSAKERLLFSFDGDATAINALDVLTSGEYDAIYNAAGVKVNGLQKGMNIIQKGGKSYKIFVK